MNPLEQLPVRRLWAKNDRTGQLSLVLVDGDYDGEWFSQFKWRINYRSGYVYMFLRYRGETAEKYQYLHHFVLPPKRGYWRTFKNGNKLDCRSANVIYKTPAQSAQNRSRREADKTALAFFRKMKQLREVQ